MEEIGLLRETLAEQPSMLVTLRDVDFKQPLVEVLRLWAVDRSSRTNPMRLNRQLVLPEGALSFSSELDRSIGVSENSSLLKDDCEGSSLLQSW